MPGPGADTSDHSKGRPVNEHLGGWGAVPESQQEQASQGSHLHLPSGVHLTLFVSPRGLLFMSMEL